MQDLQCVEGHELAWSNFKPTPTGLEIVGEPTYDQWDAVGKQLQYISGAVQWWIGDWLNYGERKWGEMYSQAIQESTGYEYDTLRAAAWVADRIESVRRRTDLTWSHHREVAAFEPEEQDELLDWAEDNKASRNDLREKTRTHKRELQLASLPKDELKSPLLFVKSGIDYMRQSAPETVDLLLTDPPYITEFEDAAAFEGFVREWLTPALATLKPTGQGYICTGAYPQELRAYLNVLDELGWMDRTANVLVWTYRNTIGPQPSEKYIQNWQAILYVRGAKAPALNAVDIMEQLAVQDINAPDGRQGDRFYTWQKPDVLCERLVMHGSKPLDIVLDPFAGSGSFILAATRLGRVGIGCEVDEEAVRIAAARGCRVNNGD